MNYFNYEAEDVDIENENSQVDSKLEKPKFTAISDSEQSDEPVAEIRDILETPPMNF